MDDYRCATPFACVRVSDRVRPPRIETWQRGKLSAHCLARNIHDALSVSRGVPECYCMARGRGRRGPAAHATAQRPPLSRHISLETRGFVMLYSYFHPCLLISTAVGPWWFGGAARPRGSPAVGSRRARRAAAPVGSLRLSGGRVVLVVAGWCRVRAAWRVCARTRPARTGGDQPGTAPAGAARGRGRGRPRACVLRVCRLRLATSFFRSLHARRAPRNIKVAQDQPNDEHARLLALRLTRARGDGRRV